MKNIPFIGMDRRLGALLERELRRAAEAQLEHWSALEVNVWFRGMNHSRLGAAVSDAVSTEINRGASW